MEFKSDFTPKYIIEEKGTSNFIEVKNSYNLWCSYFLDKDIAAAICSCGFSLQTAHSVYAGLSEAGLAKIEEDKITGTETFH